MVNYLQMMRMNLLETIKNQDQIPALKAETLLEVEAAVQIPVEMVIVMNTMQQRHKKIWNGMRSKNRTRKRRTVEAGADPPRLRNP